MKCLYLFYSFVCSSASMTIYDQYFYQNADITRQIEDENDAIISFFTNDEEEYFGVKGFSTLAEVNILTNMPK